MWSIITRLYQPVCFLEKINHGDYLWAFCFRAIKYPQPEHQTNVAHCKILNKKSFCVITFYDLCYMWDKLSWKRKNYYISKKPWNTLTLGHWVGPTTDNRESSHQPSLIPPCASCLILPSESCLIILWLWGCATFLLILRIHCNEQWLLDWGHKFTNRLWPVNLQRKLEPLIGRF